MSDPYSEVTRGEPGSGLSPLAWVAIVIGGFFAMGLVGLVGVGLFAAKTVSHVVADFQENPVEAFSEFAEFLDEDIEVTETDEEAGTVTLRVRDSGELVTVDLSEIGNRFNNVRQSAKEEGVEFDGHADESGGVLTIRTPDGETKIELRGNDGGGFLRVSTPDEDFHFGAGDEARGLPEWVPLYPGAKVEKRLFSAVTDEGSFGGALLRTDSEPETVLEWYKETLPREGFSASTSNVVIDDDGIRGKVEWSSHGETDRELSVVVGEDDVEGFVLILHRVEN